MMKRPIGLYIVVIACLLSGCTGYPARPNPLPLTFDNAGSLCFEAKNSSALSVYADPGSPDLCWSSTCTIVYEESHDFAVDPEDRLIQVTWHVVATQELTRNGVAVGCSADCGGPASRRYETEALQEGEYQVKIGEKLVGAIQVPLQESKCFYSYEALPRSPLPTQNVPSLLPTQ